MDNLAETLTSVGFTPKAAKVYLSALMLGEATVLGLAKHSGVKRTSIYYIMDELKERGALIETKRQKKVYYLPSEPRELIKHIRERVFDAESAVDELEKIQHLVFKRPRIEFFYGVSGFKQIWDMVFASKAKTFCIITEGTLFRDFVREKYILEEIIAAKKKHGIKSRQLIVDSPYARTIIAKDREENRQSKLLSPHHRLPFTEIICDTFVAFISPRLDNYLFIVENEAFAATRQAAFELMWEQR